MRRIGKDRLCIHGRSRAQDAVAQAADMRPRGLFLLPLQCIQGPAVQADEACLIGLGLFTQALDDRLVDRHLLLVPVDVVPAQGRHVVGSQAGEESDGDPVGDRGRGVGARSRR